MAPLVSKKRRKNHGSFNPSAHNISYISVWLVALTWHFLTRDGQTVKLKPLDRKLSLKMSKITRHTFKRFVGPWLSVWNLGIETDGKQWIVVSGGSGIGAISKFVILTILLYKWKYINNSWTIKKFFSRITWLTPFLSLCKIHYPWCRSGLFTYLVPYLIG